MRCEFKECKSGLPAKVRVNENMDDASYNVKICRNCAEYFNLKEGDDLADNNTVNEQLKARYARA